LIFSRLLVITGVVGGFVDLVAGAVQSKASLLILFSIMYIVLGCYLDTASVMVITLPFVFPVIMKFGIDPIWFGIIFVKLIEISVITPPVGLNLYAVMSGAGDEADFKDLAIGVLPFLLTDVVTLAILIALPQLSTWLPYTMIGQ
jgi:TRAP-type C4-dicarboxylate transport system permease large subunit